MGGVFVISRDGKVSRNLTGTAHGLGHVLATLPDNDREILIYPNLRSSDTYDVYRLDLTTGRTTLVTLERPSRTNHYILDQQLVPRIAVATLCDASRVVEDPGLVCLWSRRPSGQ
jgi:hypothetical protein